MKTFVVKQLDGTVIATFKAEYFSERSEGKYIVVRFHRDILRTETTTNFWGHSRTRSWHDCTAVGMISLEQEFIVTEG